MARRPGYPGIYAGEYVTARLAAGFIPLPSLPVWSVRARRPLLQDAVATALRDHLVETSARADLTLLAVHIEPEHVHVLLSLRPDMAVATAVQRLKGASSRRLRQDFPHLHAWQQEALWSTGYFVRSLGDVSVAQAKAYLDRQRAHHGL